MPCPPQSLSPGCLRPVRLSLLLQLGLLLLGALAVDGGVMLKSVFCAAVAFWSVVGLMAWRRGSKLTTSERLFPPRLSNIKTTGAAATAS